MIGGTLDHYRIESTLGEGGMGVVYKARDTHLDRFVAIKVLPRDKVADAGRKQRFVQEARAASALNHPNIVTIHDIRSDADVDFIVMELVGGRTLDKLIPSDCMPSTQALAYMSPEQVEGRSVDARSDIFGFGSVLYEGSPAASRLSANHRCRSWRAFSGTSRVRRDDCPHRFHRTWSGSFFAACGRTRRGATRRWRI